MLPTFITIAVIIAVVLWILSTQRRLVVLDENISNAMSQIGVQLSSRFDALTALLDLAKDYARHESETLIETIKSRRSVITAKSTPDDVMRQEGVISEALGRIAMDSGYEICFGISRYGQSRYAIQTPKLEPVSFMLKCTNLPLQ